MKKLKKQENLDNSILEENNSKISDTVYEIQDNVGQSKKHRGILRFLITEAVIVDISSLLFILFRFILESFWP